MEFTPVRVFSQLSVRNLYSIYHLTFEENYSFPGETHDFWELSYIIDGSANVVSGDKIYTCPTGTIVVDTPNLFHRMWVTGNHSCEIFTISFDGMGLNNHLCPGKYVSTPEEEQNIQRILSELPTLFQGYNVTESTPLSAITAPNDIGCQIIKNSLELLCLSLIRRGNEAQGQPLQSDQARCFTKTTAFLQNNVEKNLKIEDICAAVYESPSKLKYIFNRFTGGGIMQHFYRMRIEQIMRLLDEGRKVKEVAVQMDFSSPYYLSYFFKRETGMTVREYLNKKAAQNN